MEELRRFFGNFEVIVDAPGGVEKLRELILELAVRGRLVEQDPRDEATNAPLLDSLNGNTPWQIPSSWRWSCARLLGEINPRNDVTDETLAGFVPMPLVPLDYRETVQQEIRTWKDIKKGYTHIADGDVVVAKITPCFQNGKSAVVAGLENGVGAGTTELHVLRINSEVRVHPQYVLINFKTPNFLLQGEAKMTGTAGQKRLPRDVFADWPLGIPPLAEQKRIVAKVDQLMALCDELEERKTKRAKIKTALNISALDKLTNAREADEFDEHWERIRENFDLLYDNPENIGKLKEAILELAVRGRLVKQEEGDEPAEKLLVKLIDDTKRMAARRRKESLAMPAIDEWTIPFALPAGWTWAVFPYLGEFGRGKSKHRPRNDPSLYSDGSYPLVQTGDVARSDGEIRTFSAMYNEKGLAQSRLWPKGTLCITIAANIADSGILAFEACFPDSVVGLMPSPRLRSARFFEYFIRTAKARLGDFAPATAQKNINLSVLERLLIPLPPLSEQERIVTKLDDLFEMINQLTKSFAQIRDAQILIANALSGRVGNSEKIAPLKAVQQNRSRAGNVSKVPAMPVATQVA